MSRNLCAPVNTPDDVLGMLDWAYGDLSVVRDDWQYWSERAIFTPRHVCVDYVNNLMLDRLPGDDIFCTSAAFLVGAAPDFKCLWIFFTVCSRRGYRHTECG